MGDTIISVQFGLANPDDILKRSVVEVTTDKTYQSSVPVPNGVFDSRFGVIENGRECPTCKQTNQHCPGHFGHITLSRPVYLYQFFETVEKLANVICLNCSKPFLAEESLRAIKSEGATRFKDVRDATAHVFGPVRTLSTAKCPYCEARPFSKVFRSVGKAASLEGSYENRKSNVLEPNVALQPEFILRAFQRITDEDCALLGFNPKYSRPEWMVCTVLAVPPLTVRPSVRFLQLMCCTEQTRIQDMLSCITFSTIGIRVRRPGLGSSRCLKHGSDLAPVSHNIQQMSERISSCVPHPNRCWSESAHVYHIQTDVGANQLMCTTSQQMSERISSCVPHPNRCRNESAHVYHIQTSSC